MSAAWVFTAFYFYVDQNQVVRFTFKTTEPDRSKARRKLPLNPPALALLPPAKQHVLKTKGSRAVLFKKSSLNRAPHDGSCVGPQQAQLVKWQSSEPPELERGVNYLYKELRG